MKDLIGRTAGSINAGKPPEDIKEDLKGEGLSDYDCFLTYVAAKMVAKTREENAR
jgi:hypothetical protein